MTQEQINTAAFLAAADYNNDGNEPCYDVDFYNGFKAGADWVLKYQWHETAVIEPPIDNHVLICRDAGIIALCTWDGEDYCELYDGSKFHPTHWMMLPALPTSK